MNPPAATARVASSPVPAASRPGPGIAGGSTGYDAMLLTMFAALLTYVWRIQDIAPIFAKVKLPMAATIGMLVLALANSDTRRSWRTIRHPVAKWVVVLGALVVLSIPTSLFPGQSFGFFTSDFGKNVALCLILAASVRAFVDLKRYMAILVTGATIYASYVMMFVTFTDDGRMDDNTLAYYDGNDVGMLMVCHVPLALYFVIRGRNILGRLISAGMILLFILVAIKSGSRGAFLGMVAVAGYVLFMFRSVKPGVRWGSVVVGAVVLMTASGDKYWALINTLLNPEQDYNWAGNSESGRTEVWKRGIGYMMRRPILGVGASAFGVAEGTISPLAKRQSEGFGVKWSAAHNSFVQIGAELGILGLVGFIAMLYLAFRTAREKIAGRRAREPDEEVLGHALAASVVAFAVTGFFLSQAYGAFTYVLMALIVGLWKIRPLADAPPAVAAGGPVARSPVSNGRRPRRVVPPWPTPS